MVERTASDEAQQRAEYRDKLRSLSLRPSPPAAKVTRDVTDVGYVDTTEHFGVVRDSDGSGQPGELVERRDVMVHPTIIDAGPMPGSMVTFPGG